MDSLCLKEVEVEEIKEVEEIEEVEKEEEEVEEVCIYDPCQYNYLWYSACMFLATTGYSIYQEKYVFTIWPSGIFITSLNYWKKPRFNSWERTLDVSYVYSSIGYHLFRSVGAENASYFYLYFFIGITCYILSNYNLDKKRLYISAFLHSMVHLFSNIAALCLYSGYIHDTWYNPVTQKFLEVCETFVD